MMTAGHNFWQTLYQHSQSLHLDHQALTHITLNQSLSDPAQVDCQQAPWQPSPAQGIRRLLLERDGDELTTRATSIVAYSANSYFSGHHHPKGEEFFVLYGTFSDEYGDYPQGTYCRNPPGSYHQPFSRDGCLIFVKLQQFHLDDRQHTRIPTGSDNGLKTQHDGAVSIPLFDDYEQVLLVDADRHWSLPTAWLNQGVEILILAGALFDQQRTYSQGHWLRFAKHALPILTAGEKSQFLIKYGHLP